MLGFPDDLLDAAETLHHRRKGQKGPLRSAYVRRSISTTYYALFHFLSSEASSRIVGSHNDLRQRRRIVARTFSHTGMTTALGKVKGATIDRSVEDLFRRSGAGAGPIATPSFLQQIALAMVDAKSKREDADYNLNVSFTQADARHLHRRVQHAIAAWQAANDPADRDAKNAMALLVSFKGQLKS